MEYYMSTKSVRYMCIYLYKTHIMIQLVKTILKNIDLWYWPL